MATAPVIAQRPATAYSKAALAIASGQAVLVLAAYLVGLLVLAAVC